MRTLLVTGAKGFIGRNVARHFAELGWKVIGLGNGAWAEAEWSSWGLTSWIASPVTLSALEGLPAVPDAIIHCAGGGSVQYSLDHPREEFQRTVVSTQEVLEYIRRSAKKIPLVYPSSAAVYGTVKDLPISELAPLNPISPYGVFRKITEDLLQSYGKSFGLSLSVIRFFSVYGPGLRKQLLWDACEKISKGDFSFFGTGEELRDWLHVDDACRLIELALTQASPACPVLNGASGKGTPIKEVIRALAAELEASGKIQFKGQTRAGDPVHYVADTGRITDLGWRNKIDLNAGICDYVRWYKTNRSR